MHGVGIKTLITYYDNGNVTEKSFVARPVNYKKYPTIVSASSYTYTYPKLDKKHNWLVKNEYLNGKLTSVTERRISYSK
ncbi:hypothetical protein [Mucilaginibacter sp. UR6-11]|uniref:hypothetical protein n=1 Tax=Mucilaginibacter sp. UR6-11 TaxID=1435644 RepID=UPI001E3862CC|nr:hypothetical protein [Mucilaginibacter sp. UR6-11]MCC8425117.1 hypothetical protein [Mucilaginibacter sp. UR6-11]